MCVIIITVISLPINVRPTSHICLFYMGSVPDPQKIACSHTNTHTPDSRLNKAPHNTVAYVGAVRCDCVWLVANTPFLQIMLLSCCLGKITEHCAMCVCLLASGLMSRSHRAIRCMVEIRLCRCAIIILPIAYNGTPFAPLSRLVSL